VVWSIENSQNNEAAKIRWSLVPYMAGRLLDVGCGPYKVFPCAIGCDSGKAWGKGYSDVVADGAKLDLFASQSVDCLFSSHLLEHIVDYKAALREWGRVVKTGGYICLYLPHKSFYPNKGQFGANPDHAHDFMPEDIIEAMKEIGGFDLLENEDRNETDEYSFWQVYEKLPGKKFAESWRAPKPEKTCAVVRYGAYGDMAQVSSIFPGLKEQGYHITLYCQAGGYEVVKHDPHIDRFIVQEKDAVPPQFLEEFWTETRKKYDKWVNLCESVEGTLIASPGRANWEWPNELRAKYMDRNYLEWTHELAQVPPPYRPKFYSTLEERAWARRTAQRWGRRNILWSLAGSSGHKVWPHLDQVIQRILRTYDDVHVVLVGDQFARLLQSGWDTLDGGKWVDVNPRVHCKSDVWSIRESMAFAEVADLIIGTETGLLNAAGSMDAWKIVTMSHSSQNMLTRHWKNVIALEQPKVVGCNKQPCRQLHGANNRDPWEDCPQEPETGTALCQFHIGPNMMWEAITSVLDKQRMAA
jgi:ADP-heptose:LPS heptosyltransferase/predicted SAM-dependent methyltransferase